MSLNAVYIFELSIAAQQRTLPTRASFESGTEESIFHLEPIAVLPSWGSASRNTNPDPLVEVGYLDTQVRR